MPCAMASFRRLLALIAVACALMCRAAPVGASCDVWVDCHLSYGCGYIGPGVVSFGPGPVGIRNPILYDATPCNAVPGLVAQGEYDIDIRYNVDITMDSFTWTTFVGTAHGRVRVDAPVYSFERLDTDLEMLQLDLSGGTLPAALMVRESPSLASPGHTWRPTFQWLPGLSVVTSFFDVFMELSLDGGQSWTPAGQAAHLDFQSVSPTPTLNPTWGTLKVRYRN